MIMNAKPSQRGICGDAKAGGRARSRRLELYTRSIFGGLKKKSARSLLPPAAADCAWGVRLMETRSRNEDDKLSTEPGQLHLGVSCSSLPSTSGDCFTLYTARRCAWKRDRTPSCGACWPKLRGTHRRDWNGQRRYCLYGAGFLHRARLKVRTKADIGKTSYKQRPLSPRRDHRSPG